MWGGNKKLIKLRIILTTLLLTGVLFIITTPIHEASHWAMSELDPYIEPVEFHLFDYSSYNNGNFLFSTLGYVVVKEKYPGAFQDRPIWLDLIQELICILIQLILVVLIVSKSIIFLI